MNSGITFMDYYLIGAIVICLFRIYSLNNRISELEEKFARFSSGKTAFMEEAPKLLSSNVMSLAADPAGKIEAIKAYREETGCDLKEAKDAVENYINRLNANRRIK